MSTERTTIYAAGVSVDLEDGRAVAVSDSQGGTWVRAEATAAPTIDPRDLRIAQLEAALRAAKLRSHYESAAPCPLTLESGHRGDLGDACTCGVDRHNAAIDRALAPPAVPAALPVLSPPLTEEEHRHPLAIAYSACHQYAYNAECIGDSTGKAMAISIGEWIKAEIRSGRAGKWVAAT